MICTTVYITVYYVIRHAKQQTKGPEKMANGQKEAQTNITKGLLDLIILQNLSSQPMHGYQITAKIRESFGVCVCTSTIYPFMAQLEKKGYVKSAWNTESKHPRNIYKLTTDGQAMLNFTEHSLTLLCQKLGTSIHTRSDQNEPTIMLELAKKTPLPQSS